MKLINIDLPDPTLQFTQNMLSSLLSQAGQSIILRCPAWTYRQIVGCEKRAIAHIILDVLCYKNQDTLHKPKEKSIIAMEVSELHLSVAHFLVAKGKTRFHNLLKEKERRAAALVASCVESRDTPWFPAKPGLTGVRTHGPLSESWRPHTQNLPRVCSSTAVAVIFVILQ